MRDVHAENLRSLSGGFGILVGRIVTNAADHIEAQAAEIDRLRALVEAAYREGWANRHNHFRAQPPDLDRGWRGFASRHGLDSPAD